MISWCVWLAIGLVGAVMVGIGEYMLHFHPSGPAGEIDMLLNVDLEQARLGHLIALPFIPFYFGGYIGLWQMFKKQTPVAASVVLSLGVVAFTCGGVWISSRYMGAFILQRDPVDSAPYAEAYEMYASSYQIIVWGLRILVAGISAGLIYCIVKSKHVSNWFIALNPIAVLIVVISSLFWLPPLGIHIAPMAMNVAHFVLFGAFFILSVRMQTGETAA